MTDPKFALERPIELVVHVLAEMYLALIDDV
jgi:hypothetical protein